MNKKAIFVLLTIAALGFSGMAGAAGLPEGNMGNGATPDGDNSEAGFGLFAQDDCEQVDAKIDGASTNMPEAQVGSGTTPN